MGEVSSDIPAMPDYAAQILQWPPHVFLSVELLMLAVAVLVGLAFYQMGDLTKGNRRG